MYEAREQKEILTEMLGDSKAKTGIFEGTFQYDALASNSIETAKIEVELEQAYKAAFADTAKGEYLTMRAREYGYSTPFSLGKTGTNRDNPGRHVLFGLMGLFCG